MAEKKPSKEDPVLERLERMEEQLRTLVKAQQSLEELKNDISPLLNSVVHNIMKGLGEVEHGFQLEDLFDLAKRGLRSIRNLTYGLEQLENFIELWNTMEPLMKGAVPNFINFMDNLERKGVFRTYAAMLEVRAKVAAHYSADEIGDMGDAFVAMLAMLKKLSSPQMMDLMNRVLEIPIDLHLEKAKPIGPLGMLSAMGSKEGRQGLGVAVELTKALGKLGGSH